MNKKEKKNNDMLIFAVFVIGFTLCIFLIFTITDNIRIDRLEKRTYEIESYIEQIDIEGLIFENDNVNWKCNEYTTISKLQYDENLKLIQNDTNTYCKEQILVR